jgi:hypothetical protein
VPADLDAFGNPAGPTGTGRLGPPAAPGPAPAAPPRAAGPPIRGATIAPAATVAFIIGVFGILVWIVSPFAWLRANRALAKIDASMGRLGGRGLAGAARILGIVGTVLLGLAVLFGIIGAVDPRH